MTANHNVKKKLYSVPEFSQFLDVVKDEWKNRSCGVVSLSMVLNYFNPRLGNSILTHWLIDRAMERGDCYLDGKGWKHSGLVALAKEFDFEGECFDFFSESDEKALKKFFCLLKNGPLIVSVYNDFDSKNAGGHLIVVKGFEKNGEVNIFVNDPAMREKNEKRINAIPLNKFTNGWKRRFIAITNPSSHK